MNEVTVRPATSADLLLIAAYIASINVLPEHRCLHCDDDVAAVRRSIEQLSPPPEQAFVVAEQHGELVGLIGCDVSVDQGRGWLWGPFANIDPWDGVVDRLYVQFVQSLPEAVQQLDDFMDLNNQRGINAFERQGFVVRGLTHVYETLRPTEPLASDESLPDLDEADADAFRELHDRIFPGTYKDGTRILADRDAVHRLFAYGENTLLGYLYASPSDAEDGGYIHYVGVREDARGRSIGHRLVMSALHWMFDDCGYSKVSLTVADTHEKARALYERAGFRLLYTGVGQRKIW